MLIYLGRNTPAWRAMPCWVCALTAQLVSALCPPSPNQKCPGQSSLGTAAQLFLPSSSDIAVRTCHGSWEGFEKVQKPYCNPWRDHLKQKYFRFCSQCSHFAECFKTKCKSYALSEGKKKKEDGWVTPHFLSNPNNLTSHRIQSIEFYV